MTDDFAPPDIRLGDSVYWYSDPMTLQSPSIGWVCERPGTRTISVLVFAPGTGFIEKQSVRYKDDPGLRENPAWRQCGCWDFSDEHKDLVRARQVMSATAMTHERESRKTSPNAAK
jgi:hypothetical protein